MAGKVESKSGSGNTDNEAPGEQSDDDTKTDDTEDGGKGGGGAGGKDEKKEDGKDVIDLATLPESVQKHIKDIRKENAKYRTKANKSEQDLAAINDRLKKLAGGDEETETPEERVSQLEAGNSALAFRNACLSVAIENGIGKGGYEYFEYLVSKAVEGLEDGEELDDEAMAAIVSEAQAKGGGITTKKTKTSVTGDGDGDKKPDGDKGAVTLEQFCKMTMSEKSTLYTKQPAVYEALHAEAKSKRMLV